MHNGNLAAGSPALILLCGLPGAGKTTFAKELARRLPFEHIESDAVRLALSPAPRYSPAESAAVFARVDAAARKALKSGRHALIDATNVTNRDRKRFLRLAHELGARLVAVRLTAPDDVIRERLRAPREGFSQAGVAVFERMRPRLQPLAVPAIVVDSRFSFAPAIDLVVRLVDDREL